MPGMPVPKDDEKEQLLVYLGQQRSTLRLAAYGLSDEQARMSPTVSDLTVGGLIKHVTKAEVHWIDLVLETPSGGDRDDYDQGFRLGPDETLESVLSAYEAAAARTEDVVHDLALDSPVPVPKGVPWFPKDIDAWTLRWVLLHLIEETARHAGHADIIRESIDGATWYALMSAAESWDLRPWVEPWQPASAGRTT